MSPYTAFRFAGLLPSLNVNNIIQHLAMLVPSTVSSPLSSRRGSLTSHFSTGYEDGVPLLLDNETEIDTFSSFNESLPETTRRTGNNAAVSAQGRPADDFDYFMDSLDVAK